MELKGSLKERPALELLASMARERSSGVMSMFKGREGIQVHWSNGKIVQVTPNPIPKQGNFGQMMVEIGQVTPNQLEQALGQQRRSLAPLGAILGKLFHCDPNKVLLVLRVQAIERLYATFFWKSGHYTFEAQPITPPSNHFEPIDMNALVQEAIPVRELWPKARKRFHSPYLEVEAIGPSIPHDIQLGPSEKKIFSLLTTGMFRFRELSILGGLGQFATGFVLHQLQEHQLIIVRTPQQQRFDLARLLFGGTVVEFAVWLFVMAMLVGASTYLLAFAPYSPLHLLRPYQRYYVAPPGWEQTVEEWRHKRLQSTLELYRLHHGYYPKTLKVLSKQGWIASELLLSSTGKLFFYRRFTSHRYQLLRPLP